MNFSLYKISSQRILGGVCAGLADAAKIDPTIVRIVAALLCIYWPFMIVVYLLLTVLLPEKLNADIYSESTVKDKPNFNHADKNTDNNAFDSTADPFIDETKIKNNGSFHASNMIFAIILICGGVGLFITRVIFNYAIGFDDFITFIMFGVGIFLLVSGIMEEKTSRSIKSSKITLGVILTAVSLIWILKIFGYVIMTMGDLISSVRFLWPIFIIAIGVNILLPKKKATVAIWISVAVIIILITIYRSMYGMFSFM